MMVQSIVIQGYQSVCNSRGPERGYNRENFGYLKNIPLTNQ